MPPRLDDVGVRPARVRRHHVPEFRQRRRGGPHAVEYTLHVHVTVLPTRPPPIGRPELAPARASQGRPANRLTLAREFATSKTAR